MRVDRVQLKNFRGFEELDLRFGPGSNLLVGVNGSGKSSVLDAVAMAVGSDCWNDEAKEKLFGTRPPTPSDLRVGANTFDVSCEFTSYDGREERRTFSGGSVDASFGWSKDHWSSRAFVSKEFEIVIFFGANRTRPRENGRPDNQLGLFPNGPAFYSRQVALRGSLSGELVGYSAFKGWYAEAEAIESAERLGTAGVDWRDPVLSAVRASVESLGTRWSDLRFDRKRSTLTLKKHGQEFEVGILSDGEKALIALAGEIGWRLAVGWGDPKTAEAVVLLDEVELHLHPGLQRVVLPRLEAAFPKVQFICTTHSPQVVASVPSERVHVLENFKVVAPSGGTLGRDSNSLLVDVFGTDARPADTREKLDEIARAIDAESYAEARTLLRALEATLGKQDRELNRLGTLVAYLDAEP